LGFRVWGLEFTGLARALRVEAGGVLARAHPRKSGRELKSGRGVGVLVEAGVGGEAVGGGRAVELGGRIWD